MDKAKMQARKFIRKYRITRKKLNPDDITKILHSMGFSVIRYSHKYNDEFVASLIVNIHREKLSQTVNSFYYVDSSNRFVFILDGLSDDDTVGLLIHEIGHIYCDECIIRTADESTDFQREKSANNFMAYVLARTSNRRKFLMRLTIISIICAATIILAYNNYYMNSSHLNNTGDSEATPLSAKPYDVVVTKSGSKYHSPDCRHVTNKENLMHMTVEEAETAGYEPCEDCKPNK